MRCSEKMRVENYRGYDEGLGAIEWKDGELLCACGRAGIEVGDISINGLKFASILPCLNRMVYNDHRLTACTATAKFGKTAI